MRKAIIILIVLISIVACKDGEYDVAIGELYHVTTTQGNGYLKVENASRRRWKGSYYEDCGELVAKAKDVRFKLGKRKCIIDSNGKVPIKSMYKYEEPEFVEFSETWTYRDSVYEVRTDSDIVYGEALGYWTSYPDFGASFIKIFLTKRLNLERGMKDLNLSMDMYFPKDNGECSRPLLVLVHGGAFFNGDKTSIGFPEFARYFAGLSYVVASVNYRLGFFLNTDSVEKAGFRAVQDVDAAIRYIVHDGSYNVDPERVFVAGTSSGGITALNVAFMKDKDIPQTAKREGRIRSVNPGIDETYSIRAVGNMWGAVNDLSILNGAKTSVISFHSTDDPIVPFGVGHPFKKYFLINEVIFPQMYGSDMITKTLGGAPRAILKPYNLSKHEIHIDDLSGEKKLNSRFYEIKDEMHKFFSDVMLPSPVRIEHAKSAQRFFVNSDDVTTLYWKVEGGVIIDEDNKKADILFFPDTDSHTITVSGKYKSGLTFYESFSL